MQISNSMYTGYNAQNKVSFQANISKLRKLEIVKQIEEFTIKQTEASIKFNKTVYGTGSFLYATNLLATVCNTLNKNYEEAAAFGLLAFIMRGGCMKNHKRSLVKAKDAVKMMSEKGFNDEEKLFGTKKYLSIIGDPIFSTLFKLLDKQSLIKLSKGQPFKDNSFYL